MPREIITLECTEARKEGKAPFPLHHHSQQKAQNREAGDQEVQPVPAPPHASPGSQVSLCHARPTRKNRAAEARSAVLYAKSRTPRPKPKIDFTVDALDFKNNNLLRQFVTDQGRMLPRKYTGLPAHYQRRLSHGDQARAPDAVDEVISLRRFPNRLMADTPGPSDVHSGSSWVCRHRTGLPEWMLGIAHRSVDHIERLRHGTPFLEGL